jgi:tRNA splicing endonuclease
MVWRKPKDHSSDCYFSLRNITSKSKHIVKYPDLSSAMRTVHTVKKLPAPKPLENDI